MFVNSIEWARGLTANPLPPLVRVGIMGDYNQQLERLLAGYGYAVSAYGSGDYSAVTADVMALNLDALILNTLDDSSAFTTLVSEADDADCGLIFLSTRNHSTTGLGVLSSRVGDPVSVSADASQDGPVKFNVVGSGHPVLSGFTVGNPVAVVNGGKNDYVTFTLAGQPSPSVFTSIGQSRMKTTGEMIAVRDRNGNARQVILSPLGVNSKTHVGHWTQSGQTVLLNAIEWARAGSP